MKQPDSVFFDLDGTLTDPLLGISRCIEYALDRLNVDRNPDDDYSWCIGPPLRESFATLVGDDLAAPALAHYRKRFATTGWLENTPYDGIHATLASLKEDGLSLYVATSKPLVYAKRILRYFELAQFFDASFGAELDGTRSDKSELLKHALAASSANHADVHAAMIGDRRHDIVGARSNSLLAIGVSYGYGSVEELLGAGADQIVNSPMEIVAALRDSGAASAPD